MKTRMKCWLWFGGGIVVAGLLAAVVPLAALALGVIDLSAARPPGRIETALASWGLDRSLARHAPEQDNPFNDTPSVVPAGMKHDQANCVVCHGAPGVSPNELAYGLNPPAPALGAEATQSRTDGQLFWVARNGIRMTGMAAFGKTHDDKEIWHIVAFVRHLPDLTDAERQSLMAAGKEEGDHHGPTEHAH